MMQRALILATLLVPAIAFAAEPANVDVQTIGQWIDQGQWLPAIGGVITLLVLAFRQFGFLKIVPAKQQGWLTIVLTGLATTAGLFMTHADVGTIVTTVFMSLVAPLFAHFVGSDKETAARAEVAKVEAEVQAKLAE